MAHTSALSSSSSSSGGTPSPSAGTGGAGISSGTGSAGNAAGSAGNAAGAAGNGAGAAGCAGNAAGAAGCAGNAAGGAGGAAFETAAGAAGSAAGDAIEGRPIEAGDATEAIDIRTATEAIDIRAGRTGPCRWRSTCRCWNRHLLLLLLTPNELLDVPRRSCRWRGSRAEEFVLPTLTHSNSFHIQITEHQWKFLQDRFGEACVRPLNTVERRLEAIAQLLIARHT